MTYQVVLSQKTLALVGDKAERFEAAIRQELEELSPEKMFDPDDLMFHMMEWNGCEFYLQSMRSAPEGAILVQPCKYETAGVLTTGPLEGREVMMPRPEEDDVNQ